MLKQRVVTASVLMAVFLITLFWMPSAVFIGFLSVVFILGAWEWSDLSGFVSIAARVAFIMVCALTAILIFHFTDHASDIRALKCLFVVVGIWWALASLFIRLFPNLVYVWRPRWIRAIAGLFVLVPAWISVQYLLAQPKRGMMVLLCLLIVAAVDIGAYFSGRKFGRRKLAPHVSPGKSWEGVFGGLALSLLLAVAFVSLFSDSGKVFTLVLITIPVALSSIIGDLLESMIKRERGLKDSGSILPGHGGVLDRIDGMLPAIPIFSLAVILTGWQL